MSQKQKNKAVKWALIAVIVLIIAVTLRFLQVCSAHGSWLEYSKTLTSHLQTKKGKWPSSEAEIKFVHLKIDYSLRTEELLNDSNKIEKALIPKWYFLFTSKDKELFKQNRQRLLVKLREIHSSAKQ